MSQSAPASTGRADSEPGLFVHHGPDPLVLLGALGQLIAEPLTDPFAFEVIGVPSAGVERWLSQSLAARLGTGDAGRRDGVAAGIDYLPLEKLITKTIDAGIGDDDDPWSARRLPWSVLEAMSAARGEDWFAAVDRHTWPAQHPAGRAWATATRIAGLFRSYARQRPEMIDHWRSGADLLADGQPISADRLWQPRLYRAVAALAEAPDPVERVMLASRQLRREPMRSDLPQRVALFGPTRLDAEQLQIVAALAAHRAIHIFTPYPSATAQRAIAAGDFAARGPRSADMSRRCVRHRLLNRLGRDSRELQLRLGSTEATWLEHSSSHPEPVTLLERLQAQIRADQPPVAIDHYHDDQSLTIHRSHGPDRQVEVLADVVLGILRDDPSLEPRDIIVLCPDIETFAPLISATFGQRDTPSAHPAQQLQVRLADRSLLQLNPLLAVLSELLQLADSRGGLSQVFDLCRQPPVARAFGLSADDLDRLHELAERAGVRWGLDAEHRQRFAMERFGQNTWQAGLDRLLLGIAMDGAGQHYLGTALPMEDVDSSDVSLIGKLAELLSRLRYACAALSRSQPAAAWIAALRESLEAITDVPTGESWQLAHAYATLADLAPADNGVGSDTDLTPADIRAMFAEAFRGRPSRANFRTGALTLCTLTPMRSVPHRVVCLLGMDDDRFPRTVISDGDDLLAAEPWIGDHAPRSEDRQLLLDAIMAAQEQLVIIHSGTSERTGQRREPSIPVQELIDNVAELVGPAGLRAITTDHPLQPFSPANFSGPRPISFDVPALAGARAKERTPVEPPQIWSTATLGKAERSTLVELTELINFYTHPARELLRNRAGLAPWVDTVPPPDEIPVDLDGLAAWKIGDRLLDDALSGSDLDHLVAARWRSGEVPPRSLGARTLGRLRREVDQIQRSAHDLLAVAADSHQVLAEAGQRQVLGVVPGVRGTDIVEVGFSRLAPRQRMIAWLRLLALTAAEPGRPWRAITIGKSGASSVLGPIAEAQARSWLHDLIIVRDLGLDEPLPLPLRTAALAAEIGHSGRAEGKYELTDAYRRELDDIWTLWYPDYQRLSSLPTRKIDAGNSETARRETRRMRALGRRIWDPLLDAEETR